MSHVEVRLNRRFWRSKKVVQVVQIGGRGGPCPNFSSAFHKLYIMGQFGDGEGGGRSPLPKFFGTLALRKSGISCPNFGEGGSR